MALASSPGINGALLNPEKLCGMFGADLLDELGECNFGLHGLCYTRFVFVTQAGLNTNRFVPVFAAIRSVPRVDIKKRIGERIRISRDAKRLTLKQLSRLTGGVLSESRISNYEQGIRQLKSKEALVLAVPLGVEPSYLLCVEGEEEGEMTAQESALLRNFRALPENERGAYARRIEVLALAYREPVPDERLGPGWTAPSMPTNPQKRRHRTTTK